TCTAAVVFMLPVLQPQDPMKLLDEFLPNNNKVWKQWKAVISEQLRHCSQPEHVLALPNESEFLWILSLSNKKCRDTDIVAIASAR
ncbi:hypothetical protein EV363DRAFT_1179065, partial [Boletus edulis]